MKLNSSILALALGGLIAAACSHDNAQNQPGATAAQPGSEMSARGGATQCPLAQLRGVHASVANIDDGVAITFTGPQDELDQLRNNVHAMADANDKQGDAFASCPCAGSNTGGQVYGSAESMPNDQAGASGSTSMQGSAVPSDAKVEDITTGAILKLTSKDKSQTQALRDFAHREVRDLKQNCLNQNK
jgi:acylphosphatase